MLQIPARFRSWGGALVASIVLASLGLGALGLGLALQQGDKERPAVPASASGDVWSVAVSADGKVVAAGAGWWDKPGEIGVWGLAAREPLQRFAEELGVASVALSPDGQLLASGSWTGHVRVYDWAAGQQLHDFPVSGVARVAFSPDGRLLATATEDRTAQLWDVSKGRLLADLEGDLFRFHCVAFSPDGSRVLAGGGDWKPGGLNQVTVWDVASKQQVLKLTGHQNAILAISYSPDGKWIATGSADNTVRLWDADSGKHLRTLSGHQKWVESVAFSADGKTLVSGSHDATVRFWDLETGRETDRINLPGVVKSVRFTPNGKAVLVGGALKTLKIVSRAEHKELAALWNGADPQAVPMENFPLASPPPVSERRWLRVLRLLGLGLGFLVSLTFAVRLSLRHRRAASKPADLGATPPPLSFPCPACGKKLRARAELAGKKVKCPHCGQPAAVPENKTAPLPLSPPARWWTRPAVLAAFTVTALLAALFVAGLWLSRARAAPRVSRLQMLANRVRAQRTDVIDARPYPGVTDQDLAALQGLTNLRVLNLDGSAITDEGLKVIAGLDGLVRLSLTNTQISDAGLAELRTLVRLEFLRLDKLPITDAGLAHLTAFPRLRELSLFKTSISDEGLAHLKGLSALENLSVEETAVGDEGLRHLAPCSNLKVLKVWRTGVTPAGIRELQKALPLLRVTGKGALHREGG